MIRAVAYVRRFHQTGLFCQTLGNTSSSSGYRDTVLESFRRVRDFKSISTFAMNGVVKASVIYVV